MDITLSACVVAIGIYGLCTCTNIIKSVICLNMAQAGIILLFLSCVHSPSDSAPITGRGFAHYADPLPQALVITAIVIGASVTSLSLILSIRLFHEYGSLEWSEIFNEWNETFKRRGK